MKNEFHQLSRILNPENIISNETDLLSYSRDLTPYLLKPDIVVLPETTKEVSEVLKFANEKKIPVTMRGSGASFTGSSLPREGGLVLDMSQMNQIKKISPEDFICVAQPGVSLGELNNELRKYGLTFPHDIGSKDVSSLGGVVASDSHGHHGLKYGKVGNWIIGLEIVLVNGKIVKLGTNTLRNNCGFNLIRLFAGSQGTLCAITEITICIAPLPKMSTTIGIFFDEMENVMPAVRAIMQAGVEPSAIELVDQFSLNAVNKTLQLGFPKAEAMMITDVEAPDDGSLVKKVNLVKEMCIAHGGHDIQWSKDPKEMDTLWLPRTAIDIAVAKTRAGYREVGFAIADPCVPLSAMIDVMKKMRQIFDKHEVLAAVFGHVGLGIIHPAVFV
ncbi:MAG: FAD-binding oxidoreductase, partial [Promethearchaeota archaeon]